MTLRVTIGCLRSTFHRSLVHQLMSRLHNGGSEAFCNVSVHRQAVLCAVQLCCCRGLFSAWCRMVSREHSGGWALQCAAVLIALLCTPTLFHPCSACDSLSISVTLSGSCLNNLTSVVVSRPLQGTVLFWGLFSSILCR